MSGEMVRGAADRRRAGAMMEKTQGPTSGRPLWGMRAGRHRNPGYAVNDVPQPQPPVAFGLVKVKPEPCIDVV